MLCPLGFCAPPPTPWTLAGAGLILGGTLLVAQFSEIARRRG
jgi:drug/metabolite transporter (DMT)-like permease